MPVSMNGDGHLPPRDEAIAMIHAALDAGVTFIDTADIYAPSWDEMGHNERIVRDALASRDGDPAGILVGTKGGITRTTAVHTALSSRMPLITARSSPSISTAMRPVRFGSASRSAA